MILPFAAVLVADRPTRYTVDSLTHDALRAIGELTTAANFASSAADALLIHSRANELRTAVLALEDIAITQADRLCGH